MNPPANQPFADIQARLAATALGSWGIFEHGNDGSIIDITAEVRRLRAEEEQRTEALASTDDPTRLRWGLDDVLWGDDDSVIVMLSGPDGEPYWLGLDQERAAVLRQNLAGPDGEPGPGRRRLSPGEYTSAWHAVEGAAGEPGADPATVLHAVLRALDIDRPAS